jgi:integrase
MNRAQSQRVDVVARRIRDTRLETREARTRLNVRSKPYWRSIEQGVHLGYRRLNGRSGSWCTRIYLGNQKYLVEALGLADDLSDANDSKILNYWQAQRKARERAAKAARSTTWSGPFLVSDATNAYLDWMRENRKSASDTAKKIAVFIDPKLGGINCAALTTEIIREWHSDLAKQPARIRSGIGKDQNFRKHSAEDRESVRRRRATANRLLTVLKAALNRAWRDERISDDKAWRRVKPFENVDAARVRYLSIQEADRLIKASAPDFRQLVLAALHTGARYGELTRLRCEDYNADIGRIAIRTSKSGKPRYVVLTDEGCAYFARICAGRPAGELMLKYRGHREWRASEQGRAIAATCKRAQLAPVNFHALRHTWASHAVMNGVPLLLVAKNLGHADTRMVEKHYGHLDESYLEQTIRRSAPRFSVQPDNIKLLG